MMGPGPGISRDAPGPAPASGHLRARPPGLGPGPAMARHGPPSPLALICAQMPSSALGAYDGGVPSGP